MQSGLCEPDKHLRLGGIGSSHLSVKRNMVSGIRYGSRPKNTFKMYSLWQAMSVITLLDRKHFEILEENLWRTYFYMQSECLK